MEYKKLKLELKSLDEQGIFEGYAAVKGNVDAYNDVIEDNAFKRTVKNKKTFPILWMHDPSKPVGLSTYMREDEKGLFTRGQIDLNTELGRMVYSGLRNGYIDSMSIGFTIPRGGDSIDKSGKRIIKEINLLEYSLITKGFAANDLALVSGFKSYQEDEKMDILQRIEAIEEELKSLKYSLADPSEDTLPTQDPDNSTLEIKAVSGSRDLPLASRDRDWDGPGAKKRIFEWAGGDDFDPAKAKRAFFYWSGDDKNRGSFKLPFADVDGNKLVAVPRALSAVEGALNGARGGVEGISDADKNAIMAKVNAYKKRMGDEEKSIAELLEAVREFNKNLRGE